MKFPVWMMRWRVAAVALLPLFASCAKPPLAGSGGSGSTTTNGLTACVSTSKGAPAAGSAWRLRTADFLAALSPGTVTQEAVFQGQSLDASGRMSVGAIDSGSYVLEVDGNAGFSAAIRFHAPGGGTTIRLNDTLEPSCRISGCVPPDMQSGRQWYARIFGLERLAVVDRATGRYDFAEVPAGQYSLRLTATGEGTAPVTVEGVVAPPGDTVRLAPFSAWKFSRTLLLNTTSTGAGVTEDVLGFPVLIRLKPDNFDFSRAKSGGADLRFMKPDNTPLPYEIEQWDSSAGRAALWVRVDTVRGGTPSNIILMFWGNPNAAAAGKGCAVFDTANGYCGVWHLANCDDATSHARNGTGSGLSDTAGIIGRCQYFSGGGYAKIPGLAGTPAAMTLSAWANLDTVQGVGSEVVSVGDAALIRMDDSWHGKGTQGAYFVDTVTDADSTHCVAKSGLFFKKTGWHFLTYTIDPRAGIERLFIDSLPAAVTASPVPIVYGGVGSDVYFGKHGNDKPGFNFTGAIDEVRIASVVRSQGWIRLSYMNQRPDDRLVVWK